MPLPPDELRAYYRDQQRAADYEQRRFPGWRGRRKEDLEFAALLRALAALDPFETLLDAPCGTGRITRRLLARGLRVTGLDSSAEMMRQGADLEGQPGFGGFVQGDLFALPFADRSFDAAVCIRVMQHIAPERRPLVLRELLRVARRGVVVAYYHVYTLRHLSRWLRGVHRSHHLVRRGQAEAEIAAAGGRMLARVSKGPLLSSQWLFAVCPA